MIYNAVLVRGGIFFNLISLAKKNAAGKRYTVSHWRFIVYLRLYMKKVKMCCFIGHRDVKASQELKVLLKEKIIALIKEKGVQYFLFGSASKFDELCLQTVTELKKQYPEIVRVYIRAKERYLTEERKKSLLKDYDDTIMSTGVENAGRATYVKRNQAMIDASTYCVFYYNANYGRISKKGGTKIAFDYVNQKRRGGRDITTINLYERMKNS
jgi:uncharacterized phage-like protein YoqJ